MDEWKLQPLRCAIPASSFCPGNLSTRVSKIENYQLTLTRLSSTPTWDDPGLAAIFRKYHYSSQTGVLTASSISTISHQAHKYRNYSFFSTYHFSACIITQRPHRSKSLKVEQRGRNRRRSNWRISSNLDHSRSYLVRASQETSVVYKAGYRRASLWTVFSGQKTAWIHRHTCC